MKYGSNVRMPDLLRVLVGEGDPFSDRCGAYFADLDWPPKPPDLPTEGQRRMRVVDGGKK